MPIDDGQESAPRPTRRRADAETPADEGEAREKVIVRSNGTVTYVGKDIAYQFWKFGLLGLDFHYRAFATRRDGRTLWATTSEETADAAGHTTRFGGAGTAYNVIDVRQSYLQKLLKQALVDDGPCRRGGTLHPLLVRNGRALARHRARARVRASEDDPKKPFVEVSGRKGLGVKADDLLDLLERKATQEVAPTESRLRAGRYRAHRPRNRGSPRSATS